MLRQVAPEVRTGVLAAGRNEGLGVEQVNVATLERKMIERPKETAVSYITDGLGNVRIMANTRTDSRGEYARLDTDYAFAPPLSFRSTRP